MENFTLNGEKLKALTEDLKKIQEKLDAEYDKSKNLILDIESEKVWTGQSADVFLTFMYLLEQYHKSFTSASNENPIGEAIDSLAELEENVDTFYSDFDEFRTMEGLGWS